MRRYLLSVAVAIVACLGISNAVHAAMAVPAPPANGYYVLDQTSTLSAEEVQKLNDQIGSYRKRTSVQFAVLMVPTIKDDYLENFSINVARTWGVGEKGKNNGVLLLIAKDDHKIRIEVGTGLEGDLTDARSSRIIRDRITPEFRKGDFYNGIRSGLDGISLAIDSSDDPLLTSDNQTTGSGQGFDIGDAVAFGFVIVWVLISWLGSILGRTKSWWLGGIVGAVLGGGGTYLFTQQSLIWTTVAAIIFTIVGLIFDYVVSKNYRVAKASGRDPSWWAGGGSFGGGGSSGGGFGGGSFGGGGASGSW